MTRIHRAQGTHFEVGCQMGTHLGARLEPLINRFIAHADALFGIDAAKLATGARHWLDHLPAEYQQEIQGIAYTSGCPAELYAQWCYCDRAFDGGCSSVVMPYRDTIWIARNNDYIYPGIWNNLSVIAAKDKIPVALFGLEGDLFSGTGYNGEKLWMHYNWLPAIDAPQPAPAPLSPFVFLRYALENCSSIPQVEAALQTIQRDGAMSLFVVDGKTNDYDVFECTCTSHTRRRTGNESIIATNHYCTTTLPPQQATHNADSIARYKRLQELIAGSDQWQLPQDFMHILADASLEKRQTDSCTVYSCIAAPAKDAVWYAAAQSPAASTSPWSKLRIPF